MKKERGWGTRVCRNEEVSKDLFPYSNFPSSFEDCVFHLFPANEGSGGM
jgi:hypothetical protein